MWWRQNKNQERWLATQTGKKAWRELAGLIDVILWDWAVKGRGIGAHRRYGMILDAWGPQSTWALELVRTIATEG